MKPIEPKANLLSDLLLLKRIVIQTGLKPTAFALPVGLSLAVGVLEGVSLWLLVSFAKGVVGMDFGFVREIEFISWILTVLPSRFAVSNSAMFIILLSMLFLTFLMKNAAQYGAAVSVTFLVRKAGNNMRKLLFGRYLTFGKLYFDRTSAGYLHSVLINFTDKVASKLVELQQFFTGSFMLLAYIGMMCHISWRLTLFIGLFFPIMNFFQISLNQRIRKTADSQVAAQAELSRSIFNVLSCILLVKAYGTEAKELAAFSSTSDLIEEYEYSIDKKLFSIEPIQEVIVLALLLSLISAMAVIVSKDGASRLPGFLVYFYVIRRAAASFGILSHLRATLASMSAPLAEVLGMLDDSGKHYVPGGAEAFGGLKSRIEFVNLVFSYEAGTPVFKGASFAIEKGKMTAIVGPSGTGKTTLINLLARFYECPPESIFVDGQDIRTFSTESLRASMALVGQDSALLNDTLKSNIVYGLNKPLTEGALDAAIRKARLSDFVSKLPAGLETNIGDRGVQLSGGEKQRVSIARAMLKDSEILILDEATSSLDSGTEKLIQEAINEMIVGKTAIIIAHRLSTIKKADKIVVVENGIVAEEGTLTQLLDRKGRFHQYWDDQKFY